MVRHWTRILSFIHKNIVNIFSFSLVTDKEPPRENPVDKPIACLLIRSSGLIKSGVKNFKQPTMPFHEL